MDAHSRGFARTAPVLFCLSLVCLLHCHAEEIILDVESDRWVLQNGEVIEHLGRKCLSGSAYVKDLEFGDGIIEYDLAVNGSRSYPGIFFRRTSMVDYERFYVRPHASGKPDALQYTPVFNNIAGWQLYSGDGFTAAEEIPADRWFHVRIEVQGTQARIFVDGGEEPSLEIPHLQLGEARGTIGTISEKGVSACFSNFRVVHDADLEFDPEPPASPPFGAITEWEISQPFEIGRVDMERVPSGQDLGEIAWKKISADPTGMVDIGRYVARTSAAGDCIFARTYLHADRDEMRFLRFGYSDIITLFLNGEVRYFGDSTYHARSPAFLGIVGYNDGVFLPLKKGRNELLLALAETFGGWGFRFIDADAVYEHASLRPLWELPRTLRLPESVVYDAERDLLYVSNYFNNGKEFLSRLRTDGSVETREWVTGLNRPTGMALRGDRLFVVERTGLAEIDVTSGEIVNRHAVPGAAFINDVAVDSGGSAFISDSRANVIRRFSDGEFSVWLEGEEVRDPNGLHLLGDELLFGNSGDGCIKAAKLADGSVRTVACIGGGSIMDGIAPDGKGNLLVSDYNGRLFRISPSGDKTELLDTRTPGKFLADFEFIVEEGLLVIPTLMDNRVMAYIVED